MANTFRKIYKKTGSSGTSSDYQLVGNVGVDGVELDIMKGASSSAAGEIGLVPKPAAGSSNRYLRCDGTWAVPPDTNTTYKLSDFGITATAAEINKLDGITASKTQLNFTDGLTSNKITSVSNSVSSLSTKHSGDISSLNGSISLTNQGLSSAVNRIITLENHVNNLIAQASALQQQITEVNNRVSSYHGGSIIG